MNEGKDDGLGESEAPSAHLREAKAWTGYGFQQRTDGQTDEGAELQTRVDDLLMLLEAYRSGAVTENHMS